MPAQPGTSKRARVAASPQNTRSEDVEFLDVYAADQGFTSRSAVLHKAVRLLRGAELGAAHEKGFME